MVNKRSIIPCFSFGFNFYVKKQVYFGRNFLSMVIGKVKFGVDLTVTYVTVLCYYNSKDSNNN